MTNLGARMWLPSQEILVYVISTESKPEVEIVYVCILHFCLISFLIVVFCWIFETTHEQKTESDSQEHAQTVQTQLSNS